MAAAPGLIVVKSGRSFIFFLAMAIPPSKWR
jgi:hypothetical protein